MIVYNVPEHYLTNLARYMGIRLDNLRPQGKGVAFVLRPLDDTYRKIGRNGRRVNAVSWQGHFDFMDVMFRAYPDARLRSAVATYKGREDFALKAIETRTSSWA